jgi:hypothetical protein
VRNYQDVFFVVTGSLRARILWDSVSDGVVTRRQSNDGRNMSEERHQAGIIRNFGVCVVVSGVWCVCV